MGGRTIDTGIAGRSGEVTASRGIAEVFMWISFITLKTLEELASLQSFDT